MYYKNNNKHKIGAISVEFKMNNEIVSTRPFKKQKNSQNINLRFSNKQKNCLRLCFHQNVMWEIWNIKRNIKFFLNLTFLTLSVGIIPYAHTALSKHRSSPPKTYNVYIQSFDRYKVHVPILKTNSTDRCPDEIHKRSRQGCETNPVTANGYHYCV